MTSKLEKLWLASGSPLTDGTHAAVASRVTVAQLRHTAPHDGEPKFYLLNRHTNHPNAVSIATSSPVSCCRNPFGNYWSEPWILIANDRILRWRLRTVMPQNRPERKFWQNSGLLCSTKPRRATHFWKMAPVARKHQRVLCKDLWWRTHACHRQRGSAVRRNGNGLCPRTTTVCRPYGLIIHAIARSWAQPSPVTRCQILPNDQQSTSGELTANSWNSGELRYATTGRLDPVRTLYANCTDFERTASEKRTER